MLFFLLTAINYAAQYIFWYFHSMYFSLLLKYLYIIGCADGLYSVNVKTAQKTKIDGIDTVWAISFEPSKDFAIAIEGKLDQIALIKFLLSADPEY